MEFEKWKKTYNKQFRRFCYILPEVRKFDASGTACYFFKFDDFGVKFYNSPAIAIACRQRQNIAAKHGLAPPTFGYCYVDSQLAGYRQKKYGYITALAVLEMVSFDVIKDIQNKISKIDISKIGAEFKKKKNRKYAMQYDIRNGNVGVYKGKVVVIDFSRHICGSF